MEVKRKERNDVRTAPLGVEIKDKKAKINALGKLGFRIDCHDTEFYLLITCYRFLPVCNMSS